MALFSHRVQLSFFYALDLLGARRHVYVLPKAAWEQKLFDIAMHKYGQLEDGDGTGPIEMGKTGRGHRGSGKRWRAVGATQADGATVEAAGGVEAPAVAPRAVPKRRRRRGAGRSVDPALASMSTFAGPLAAEDADAEAALGAMDDDGAGAQR
jgi:hypothetical protein